MKFIYNKLHLFSSLLLLSLLVACGGNGDSDSDITNAQVVDSSEVELDKDKAQQIQNIFHSVPSPMEMATILKKTGARYNAQILNKVERVNDYTTSRKQALNLGIYGSDLSYASVFNQNQESIIYLSCAKKLADKLGVSKAFDDETIERMEANIENRDSLLHIVSETYYLLDAYLKENGRDQISAMVIAAGWVEGLYIATTVASESSNPDPDLMQRIAEQKLALQNLVELVKAYNRNGELDQISADLERIEKAYADVELEQGKAEVTTDESTGVTTIGGKTTATMSNETFKNITSVVNEIRSGYINS